MLNAIIKLFPSITWKINTDEKILFLTFDDGPVPEATPFVLDMLSAHQAKATFFCIGDNILKYPEIFSRLIREGHCIGNHTNNHLNGWHSSTQDYLKNVEDCSKIIESRSVDQSSGSLFRPPYGKLKYAQYVSLKKSHNVVMWDVLVRDWEESRSPESCFKRIKSKSGPGSIIVFHDSIKAKKRMLPVLEETLQHFGRLGYRFESLAEYH